MLYEWNGYKDLIRTARASSDRWVSGKGWDLERAVKNYNDTCDSIVKRAVVLQETLENDMSVRQDHEIAKRTSELAYTGGRIEMLTEEIIQLLSTEDDT